MSDDRAYRIQVIFDAANERYRASVPELNIDVDAETRSDALTRAEAAIEEKVEAAATADEPMPRAADAHVEEPGEVTLRLAGPLFQTLNFHAHRSGIEPSDMAQQLLAMAVAQLDTRPNRAPRSERRPDAGPSRDEPPQGNDGRNRGRGNQNRNRGNQGRGGNRREGYRPEMENQADFLAYVREQEKGGGRRR